MDLIGVIVVGHGNFASELVSVSENILGKQKYLDTVSVRAGEGEHTLHNKLNELMSNMEIDDVIILSDIFGGSLSNMCLYFAKNKGHIAVVTGVNIPMVLKVLSYRERVVGLNELVSVACKGGKDGIVDACGILENNDGAN